LNEKMLQTAQIRTHNLFVADGHPNRANTLQDLPYTQ